MKKIVPLLIILIVSYFFSKPFFNSGYFPTHDGEWAIVRLVEMQREIKNGQIPPRMSDYLNHGYGYPLFSYTYPFPYYLGMFFRLFKIGYTDTIKILFILSVFLSGIFMYLFAKKLSGIEAGVFSSILYITAPYRLVNLYIRGSLGESLSMVIFPLLLYISLFYIEKPNIKYSLLLSLTLAILILTHNVMALLFFPIFISFIIFFSNINLRKVNLFLLRNLLLSIILGLGLSAFFFIPAILEKQYILLSQVKLANLQDNFIHFKDFVALSWNWGSKPFFQLGWVHILALISSICVIVFVKKARSKGDLPVFLYLLMILSILILFTNNISAIFWKIPPLSWIDFPWRILAIISFFISLFSIFLVYDKFTRILGYFIVLLSLIVNINYVKPISYLSKPDEYYLTNDDTTTSMGELMPLWVKTPPQNRWTDKVQVESGSAKINNLIYNSKSITFNVLSDTDSIIRVNTIFFPGWHYTANGNNIDLNYSNPLGVVKLTLSKGDYIIKGVFQNTRVREWSNNISLVSIFIFLGLLGKFYLDNKFRFQHNEKNN